MNGEIVKKVITENGHTITEVAEKLGMSRPNLSQILATPDVKSGLLERVSAAIGVPVSVFYERSAHATGQPSATAQSTQGDHSPAISGNGNSVSTGGHLIEQALSTIAQQQQTISQQTDIIASLINGKKK